LKEIIIPLGENKMGTPKGSKFIIGKDGKRHLVRPHDDIPKRVTGVRTRALKTILRGGSKLTSKQLAKETGLSWKYVRNVRKKMTVKGEIQPVWREQYKRGKNTGV